VHAQLYSSYLLDHTIVSLEMWTESSTVVACPKLEGLDLYERYHAQNNSTRDQS